MNVAPFFSPILSSETIFRWVLALIIVLCAMGNLPWNLDEYDQAKQAYVSHEIAHGGDWLYQHVPRGATATKPPLAGWISLAVQSVTHSWELAWRLPGFLCTLVLLGLLMHEGRRILPDGGALLAAAAFALNLLTPRISTLVRTDMMLTLWIFLCGWLIYRKIRDGTPWLASERWMFCGAMGAALLTKGPIIYAFILPGMAVYLWLGPRGKRHLVWSGWWTWMLPLGVFVAWGVNGLLTNQEFYNDVVVREFFSRFDQSLKSNERQQPIWFYFPHVLHKFLPWSLFLLALPLFSQNVRNALRREPAVLWLAAWAVGGLLCMTFVPSKRVDRVYPIIPPLCLLLVAFVAACRCGTRVRAWLGAGLIFATLFSGCYFAGVVWIGYHEKTHRLVDLGQTIRTLAGTRALGIVAGNDEGMILYAEGEKFLRPEDAAILWNSNKIDALFVSQRFLDKFPPLPPPFLVTTGKREARYSLFLRNRSPDVPPLPEPVADPK